MTNSVNLKILASGVALITLDLPDKKVNLLSTQLMTELNGVLDEVAIYNYVLSPQRISLHYAASGLPAAPSALAANAVSSSQIDLAWTDNAGNEAGFNIERSLDGISFIQIGSTTIDDLFTRAAPQHGELDIPAVAEIFHNP